MSPSTHRPNCSAGAGKCLLTGPSTSPENSLPKIGITHSLEDDDLEHQEKDSEPRQGEKPRGAGVPQGGATRRKPQRPQFLFPFVAMSPAMGEIYDATVGVDASHMRECLGWCNEVEVCGHVGNAPGRK